MGLSYYRGCWHEISRPFLLGSVKFRSTRFLPPLRQRFTTRRPSSRTRRRSVRLAPIAEDSRLQPPVGVWAVLSPSEWGHALTPHTRLCLGGPLHRQLADRTWSPPWAVSHVWSEDIIWYYRQFPAAIPVPRVANHALLSLSPLSVPLRGLIARLACLIHAANVHSEPGSNPSIDVFLADRQVRRPKAAARRPD